jgi:hypothetical protein
MTVAFVDESRQVTAPMLIKVGLGSVTTVLGHPKRLQRRPGTALETDLTTPLMLRVATELRRVTAVVLRTERGPAVVAVRRVAS